LIIDQITLQFIKQKIYCSVIYVDIAQAFEKVYHEVLSHMLKTIVSTLYYLILKFYFDNIFFCVNINNTFSNTFITNVEVPKGIKLIIDLFPMLYLIYIENRPTFTITILNYYAWQRK